MTKQTELEQVRQALEQLGLLFSIEDANDWLTDHSDVIEQALTEKLEQLETGGWRDIKSAPKNHTIFADTKYGLIEGKWDGMNIYGNYCGTVTNRVYRWCEHPLYPLPTNSRGQDDAEN